MLADDEDSLRAFFRNLQQDELAPSDPRYVPLQDRRDAFGPDVARELIRDVSWTTEGSAFFLSGLRGSGKSTQLLRLGEELSALGFAAVVLNAEDYLNLRQPVDITEFLFFLAGGVADAVQDLGLLPKASSAGRAWERLSEWIRALPARIAVTPEAELSLGADTVFASGTVNLKAELRRDESFVAQLRRFLEGRLSELANEANGIVEEIVDDLRAAWSGSTGQEWTGLIVLVDSLDHVRGADFKEVRRALVDLFDKQSATLRLSACRTVYIVPPWIHVDYAAVRKLANVKVVDRDGRPFLAGYQALDQVLERRCPAGRTLSEFMDAESVRKSIHDSGGHLRDLLRLVRGAAVATDTLPFSADAVERGRQEVRDGLLPLADDERALLARVLKDGQVPLPTQDGWETLAGLFDRHLILGYKNGETWYGVHPLIAGDVK